MQALWTVPLDSFLAQRPGWFIWPNRQNGWVSETLGAIISCRYRLYSGTTITQVAHWVIWKDLYPIRNWVIGNKDSSICTLGNRDVSCPNREVGQRDRSLLNSELGHREQK